MHELNAFHELRATSILGYTKGRACCSFLVDRSFDMVQFAYLSFLIGICCRLNDQVFGPVVFGPVRP